MNCHGGSINFCALQPWLCRPPRAAMDSTRNKAAVQWPVHVFAPRDALYTWLRHMPRQQQRQCRMSSAYSPGCISCRSSWTAASLHGSCASHHISAWAGRMGLAMNAFRSRQAESKEQSCQPNEVQEARQGQQEAQRTCTPGFVNKLNDSTMFIKCSTRSSL